jgi:hypothetical protein|tara:strand:+ start:1212 stop:2519 length:1308 start_codon:yes stop_codon:yes gene_type:complete
MSFIDNVRRRFASIGSNPSYKEDDPRSYGAGVIQRLKLSSGVGSFAQGKDYEPHIGKNRTYMNVYLSDPIIRTLIDLPCLYAVKDNFDIVTDDDSVREEVEEMFRDINIENILYGWVRNARIFGTGYLEWTGDNLVLRSSQNMYVKRNEHGQIEYYYQKVGDDKENIRFEEDEIIELKNNTFDDYAYGLSDIHPILYLVDLKDYAERDIGAALNKYASSRFDVSAGLPDMPYGPDKINEIVDAFNNLSPGEDIIHGNDIQIKELQGTQRAFEYGKYTDDILAKIHMALKVPMTMWTEPERARPIFEPYVRYLQSLIEGALNAQLMPQLEKGNAKFKFRQINVADAFTKAKTDMIYLSEGVLSPGEVREERGLNPEGVATLDMETSEDVKASPIKQEQSDKNANISGGRNQDKTEESSRVQNRGNKPSANVTGDRA